MAGGQFRLGEGKRSVTIDPGLQPDDLVDREELIKELTDLKYVVDQLCACFGYDIDEANTCVRKKRK